MKRTLILWLCGLCTFCSGCSTWANIAHTLICEPIQYARRLDDLVDCKRNRHLAEAAWEQFQQASPETEYSFDFGEGFKEGFADYLYAGGTGEPPPVPPRYYLRPEYESPQGNEAVLDWFRGFRVGAAQAHASGLRQVITIPASVVMPRRPPPMLGAGLGTNDTEELHLPALVVPAPAKDGKVPPEPVPLPQGATPMGNQPKAMPKGQAWAPLPEGTPREVLEQELITPAPPEPSNSRWNNIFSRMLQR